MTPKSIFSTPEAEKLFSSLNITTPPAKDTGETEDANTKNTDEIKDTNDVIENKVKPSILITTENPDLEEAKMWIEISQRPESDTEGCLDYAQELAKKAGYTLEDIGISEEKFAELLINGYKKEAQNWIKVSQRPESNTEGCLKYAREYAKKAGCTLEDIKMS